MRRSVLLEIKELTKHFPVYDKGALLKRKAGEIQALDSVSFSIAGGETVGLVGESGCGKTTLAKCIVFLEDATSGDVIFDGTDVLSTFRSGSKMAILRLRREIQYVFQNPLSALDPRMTVADILMEPFEIHGHIPEQDRIEKMYELIRLVGLEEYHVDRYPHEFSEGQRQRVCIARALAVAPRLIIADEPVASLDVSIRAQVLNLLGDLQRKLGLTYLFISHDLSTVKHVCDRVVVMYLGRVVETARTSDLFENPMHPYTKALFSAVPALSPRRKAERIILRGEVPSAIDPPSGCRFHTRCPRMLEPCSKEPPEMVEVEPGHFLACYNPHRSRSTVPLEMNADIDLGIRDTSRSRARTTSTT